MTPKRANHADDLTAIIHAARRNLIRTGHPVDRTYYLRIEDRQGRTALAVAIRPAVCENPSPETAEFRPTAAQQRMIEAMAGKTVTKKQLIAVAANKVYLRERGGLDELVREGIVVEVEPERYRLTDGEDDSDDGERQ